MAVVEVDHRPVGGEFIADRDPEIFVSRHFGGWTAGHGRGCGERADGDLGAESGGGGRARAVLKKAAAIHQRRPAVPSSNRTCR
jgi:hypothetical protein